MTRREALATSAAVLASAAVPPAAAAQVIPKRVAFGGYQWLVRNTTAEEGPGPNLFSDANVAVVGGKLVLQVARNAAGRWTCAEVTMVTPDNRPLGYGTYRFTVGTPADALPKDVTLGLFTWSDTKQQNFGEVDIEFARWGNAESVTNAQFVVQPYDLTDGRLVRFTAPAPPPGRSQPLVCEFDWQPTGIKFRAATATGSLVSLWYFSGPDLPTPSDERVHLNLWIFEPAAAKLTTPAKVVVSAFEFVKAR